MHRSFEERIVDLVLGNLDKNEEIRVQDHLKDCSRCLKEYENWKEVIAHHKYLPAPVPKMKMKVKLYLTIYLEQLKKKSIIVVPTITMASLLFFATVVSDEFQKGGTDIPPPLTEPFLVKADTRMYDLAPIISQPVSGYAWVNDSSEELLLVMEGLQPILPRDYQAWIQTKDEIKDAGIIIINGKTGQLYLKDHVVPMLESIIISQEPRGGSFQPTDPNPFLLRLK